MRTTAPAVHASPLNAPALAQIEPKSIKRTVVHTNAPIPKPGSLCEPVTRYCKYCHPLKDWDCVLSANHTSSHPKSGQAFQGNAKKPTNKVSNNQGTGLRNPLTVAVH